MTPLDLIESPQEAYEHSARREDVFCYFRTHYTALRRNGKPVHRYLELRCEIVAGNPQGWAYRSGYVYSDTAKFWSVPDSHRAHCAPFALFVSECAAEALRREIAKIESAASHLPR